MLLEGAKGKKIEDEGMANFCDRLGTRVGAQTLLGLGQLPKSSRPSWFDGTPSLLRDKPSQPQPAAWRESLALHYPGPPASYGHQTLRNQAKWLLKGSCTKSAKMEMSASLVREG